MIVDPRNVASIKRAWNNKQEARKEGRKKGGVSLLKSGGTVVKTVEQFEVGWCVDAVSIFFSLFFSFPFSNEGTLDEGWRMKEEGRGWFTIITAAPRSDHGSVLSLRWLTGKVAKGLLSKLTCFTDVTGPYFFVSLPTDSWPAQINF